MGISKNQRKILAILADGQFHSGSCLAQSLSISRSGVWKHVSSLEELGIEYSAVSGKGYRLESPIEFLDSDLIFSNLSHPAKQALSHLKIHDVIESTNSYLVEQAQAGAISGTVCLAEYQSAGRGRRGRTWISPFGNNIYLSILWHYHGGLAVISGLSLAIGVAVIRALSELNISDVGLKWPNDIYWQGQKLGGILVEVTGESNGPSSAVMGLGLNLFLPEHNTEAITQPWTDLQKISGSMCFSRNELTAILLNHLLPIIAGYETFGLAHYLDEWRSYDCLKDNLVNLYLNNQSIQGIAEGIDGNGLFLLKKPDGHTQAFASGEVSFNSAT